jgi:hypothetical protein
MDDRLAHSQDSLLPPILNACGICGAYLLVNAADNIFQAPHRMQSCPMRSEPAQLRFMLEWLNEQLSKESLEAIIQHPRLQSIFALIL